MKPYLLGGRVRTSTVLLVLVFLIALGVYVAVRPAPTLTGADPAGPRPAPPARTPVHTPSPYAPKSPTEAPSETAPTAPPAPTTAPPATSTPTKHPSTTPATPPSPTSTGTAPASPGQPTGASVR